MAKSWSSCDNVSVDPCLDNVTESAPRGSLRRALYTLSPNTVHLVTIRSVSSGFRSIGSCRPVSGRVVAHLALDRPRIAASSAGFAPDLEDLVEEVLMKPWSLLRGEKSRR